MSVFFSLPRLSQSDKKAFSIVLFNKKTKKKAYLFIQDHMINTLPANRYSWLF